MPVFSSAAKIGLIQVITVLGGDYDGKVGMGGMGECENVKMGKWGNGKMEKCENGKMGRWGNGEM